MQNNNAGHPWGSIYSIILQQKKPSVRLLLTLHSELTIQWEAANKQPTENLWWGPAELQKQRNKQNYLCVWKMYLEFVCTPIVQE